MDNILTVIQKGLAIIEALRAAGRDILPALKATADLVQKGKDGKVTEADLDETERILDGQIAEFNEPIPE